MQTWKTNCPSSLKNILALKARKDSQGIKGFVFYDKEGVWGVINDSQLGAK